MFIAMFVRIFKRYCHVPVRRNTMLSIKLAIKVAVVFTIVLLMTHVMIHKLMDNVLPREVFVCQPQNVSLVACDKKPIVSDKSFKVSKELHTFQELTILHSNDLSPGGHFRPSKCQPGQKIAIVIPYRDREDHLKILLNNLHPFLKKQDIDYTIFVVEQLPGSNFNRGMIRNIAYTEALKICNFDCFFFHDVDLLPDDYGNVYRCGQQPRHHTRDLERWKHKPPYSGSFGGVVSMKTEQFAMVNGYTNTYFEWGLEDDEMGMRLKSHKMKLTSYPFAVGSYVEFGHKKSKQYKRSWKWVKNWKKRKDTDGLNSLVYTLKGIAFKPLYVHLYVHINMTAAIEAYKGEIMIAQDGETPFDKRK